MSYNIPIMKKDLIIFDTTLRDGEQSPGASMTLDEKVRIAKLLEKLQVDIIEAGFPISSEGDFHAVQAVAKTIKNSTVCGLARAKKIDIERAAEAIQSAPRKRLHTFIATSPIHMKYKLKMDPDQVVEHAVSAVKLSRNLCDDVEFSCEDAGRSDSDFLCRIIEKAIAAGASTINIPDTVGYALPHQFGKMVKEIMTKVPNSDKAIFSAHCHNDLGLAVANSLAAVEAGARQVECTINGLGERAGNAALEEIVMAVKTRGDVINLNTNIKTEQIVPTSKLVSQITGFPVQPNKAIVGANAFSHEAGIHQDGVIKHRQTYEIMKAEDVGWQANKLVLGKHSGRNAFNKRMEDLGYSLNTLELDELFIKFKKLADHKHTVYDEDLHALSSFINIENQSRYVLEHVTIHTETNKKATAMVVMFKDGEKMELQSHGNGPVDAIFVAISKMTQCDASLLLYSVNAITEGTDAIGEVMVRLQKNGRIVNGSGSDLDIVTASAKAYINAINLLQDDSKINPQNGGTP